jgi:hypothetical protein
VDARNKSGHDELETVEPGALARAVVGQLSPLKSMPAEFLANMGRAQKLAVLTMG